MEKKSALLVGVGGQGAILTAKVLVNGLMKAGFDVKMSEVHGMSQRGGSVVTYVRADKKVYSPVIDMGEADLIISFEALESARWLPYLKKGGVIVSNTAQIDPMPVIMGNAVYPEKILEQISQAGVKVVSADALSLAVEAGSAKAVNIVLLGIAAKNLGLDYDVCINAIRATVPAKTIEVNEKAFDLGYNL